MTTAHAIADTRHFVRAARQQGRRIGFVPTMGALHQGHLSLMELARRENDAVAISVFVNPTQFGPAEDYDAYPRDLDRDAALAEGVGVDLLFAPSAAAMYPDGATTYIDQTGTAIETLEGAHRPGHFRGVLTVCGKLFHIVEPDRAYFGQKDYQQVAAVTQMVRDLALPIAIVPCPIVREPDGLAMSSRNQYLDADARQQATGIYRGLQAAQARLDAGESSAAALADVVRQTLLDAGHCTIDYVAIVHPQTLAPVEAVAEPAVALVAARFGGTRLIDNHLLTPKG